MQARDLDPHLDAQFGIEVGERFVEQEHLRLAHDGAADGDALALAAGQLPRLALHEFGMRRISAARLTRRCVSALSLPVMRRPKEMFSLDRHVRIERVGLEHHGDTALGGLDVVHDLAADHDLTVGDILEPGDHAQQRGLAAARGADEHHEFAVRDFQAGAVDDAHRTEFLDDVVERNCGHLASPI